MPDKKLDVLSPTEHPQGKNAPWCHRFMIPMPLMEQAEVLNPLNGQKMVQITPKPQLSFVKCLGPGCAIWDRDSQQCGDLTRAQESKKTNVLTDQLVKVLSEYATRMEIKSGAD